MYVAQKKSVKKFPVLTKIKNIIANKMIGASYLSNNKNSNNVYNNLILALMSQNGKRLFEYPCNYLFSVICKKNIGRSVILIKTKLP